MKNNILNRFAINDLKTHKKDSIITIITIFIVSVISMTISFISPLLTYQQFLEEQYNYGNYTYHLYGLDHSELQEFKQSQFIINGEKETIDDITSCIRYHCGETLQNNIMYEIEGDESIIAVHLKEGRLPENKNEIAITQNVLSQWNYTDTINSQIKLVYIDSNQQLVTEEFQVVGLLDSYNCQIVVTQHKQDSSLSDFYIKTQYDEKIDNAKELSLEQDTTVDDYNNTSYNAIILTMITALIIIIAASLMYGLTITSFEKKQKDYALLRSIGITQRQMYYIIFIQSLLLSVAPIVLSILLIYIVSIVLPLFVSLSIPMPFSLGEMIWNACIVFFIVLISYFMPARSVTRKALVGTFEGQEFQYIYYRYKKLHQMRPFYLAWRQLVSLKRRMIVKVFLIMIITVLTMLVAGYTILDRLYIEQRNHKNMDNNTIQCEIAENLSQKDIQKDFQNLMPYIQTVESYQCIDSMYGIGDNIDLYRIYCTYYDSQKDLQPGQMIVTRAFLDENDVDESQPFGLAGYQFDIVGIDEDHEDVAVYLHEDDFQIFKEMFSDEEIESYSYITFAFDNIEDKIEFLFNQANDIAKLKEKYSITTYNYDSDETYQGSFISSSSITRLLIISSLAVIYIYQFIFEILKQREDIGSYQLLGLTHKEIWSIYLFKSIIIISIGFVLGTLYYLSDIYIIYKEYSLEQFALTFENLCPAIILGVIVIIIILLLSLSPLRYIMKKEGFENKNIRE